MYGVNLLFIQLIIIIIIKRAHLFIYIYAQIVWKLKWVWMPRVCERVADAAAARM